ncbi:pleiotropic drug resistance protein 1-like [Thalictrum thalictroides]|uniref:Pleiotropic drug resistance protein 1-like n=1 Tax=Thalictrum thalictroides TaxID=46969 RepID=A0A7J6W0T3_THATH|nr:pleiotropic drug resistance protein 1-like [Thalictrum thalictroides]
MQCMACLWKQYWSYWRNTPYTAVRFLFTTSIAILLGIIFWDLGSRRSRPQELSNAMGSMYIAVLFIGIQNASSVQPVVAIERIVFYRERAAGMYSPLAYAFGQAMIEVPYIFVQSLTYGVIVYAMIGYESTIAKFVWSIFFMFFTFLYFTYFGMMAVAASPNGQVAAIVSGAFYGLWSIFSGFMIPRPRIPIWWKWYYWASPFSWSLYGLLASQYGDITDRLDKAKQVKFFLRNYYGFKHDFLPVVAVVIVGFNVLFVSIFALWIKSLNYQRR